MFSKQNKSLVLKIFFLSICIISVICTLPITSFAQNKLNVYAPSYIAYDRITKKAMFGKNIDKKVPMASTTKIMTAILTIEYGKLNETVTVTQNAQNVTGWQLKLQKGDKISLQDLLYAIMLYSANDGAVAIAEHIGGSVEGFCKMMNEKAKQLGAYNTNFTSPHGLDNDMHYSTPYDLAIIMDYALNIDLFRKVISTHNYTININGHSRSLNNTNKLLTTLSGSVGGKTGYTGKAGYCLVNNCKKDNMDVIAVVLGAGTTNQRFNETKEILEYAIENYEIVNLNEYIKDKVNIRVEKCIDSIIEGIASEKIDIPIKKGDKEKIRLEYCINSSVTLPVKEKQEIGYVNIFLEDTQIGNIKYVTEKEYTKNTYSYYMKYILGNYINLLKIE